MIDVHDVATTIIEASRSPVPGNVALQRAVRVTTEKLAECWDDCARIVAPMSREIDNPNPYRLALELTPDGPSAPRVEFVDEPDAKTNPESEDRLRHVFFTSTDDAELNAMQIIVQALEGLDDPTQHRIIRYVSERIA